MKKPYESPVILKTRMAISDRAVNSLHHSQTVRSTIDDIAVNKLTDDYGSPLFVFSEKTMRQRYRDIYMAFSTRYPAVTFGWSYKTNYLSAICSILHQEGALAEVVSDMEYDKARALGVPGENIIYNGPNKSVHSLRKAIADGASINVDHLDEIYDISKVADSMGRKVKIGLRLNLDAGIHPQWFRFGFNLESGQAMDAVELISKTGSLIVNSLHCHLGTYIMDPNAYVIAVQKMLSFAYEVEDSIFGFKIESIDIGGGLPSKSKLKGTYHGPDIVVPSIDEYAEKITTAIYTHKRDGNTPRLILECGRAIIDETGYLIVSVVASKRLPDGRKAYVVDGGINLLYTSFWYKYNIELTRQVGGLNEESVIYGPLCMNIDVIEDNAFFPSIDRGERIVISPVGAYNVSQWMQFIEYRPNIVLIAMDGSVDVVREAENLTDIQSREIIPERLLARPKI
ncbi:diaminopimelate decarboxylase [Candidatus Omnitrophus magneticus]|uniref:Diaminopimelate decarboxylase n=1 Tax=Candidatus Omnitrophus magneticus TaxID=1609969 RepID=A0A0F0CRD3_9BACT|nr:diaminopimelate decarboxylase [Candidatus Omnitrophus magneticus]